MKNLFTLLFVVLVAVNLQAQTSVHTYRAVTLAGDTISMSQYYGKKLMIINCASYCAYTPQYRGLESLYSQYHQYNFELVGFPSDDFGAQGGTDSAIVSTCNSYNVTFQIMEKVHCITGDTSPIFKWLQRKDLNGVSDAAVSWNFNKFLIDEAGHWVRHFDSPTSPTDTAITNWILSPSVLPTTGISTVQSDNLVALKSSNPTNTSIDFLVNTNAGERVNVALYSIEGKLVNNTIDETVSSTIQDYSYNTTTLPSGTYLLKVQTNSAQKVLRIIVQH